MEKLTYEYLRRLQEKEKKNLLPVELSEDFYTKVAELLAEERRKLKEKHSLSNVKEYENILKILGDIFYRREQKILIAALRSTKGKEEMNGLTLEEKSLFESVVRLLKKNEEFFESIIKEEKVKDEKKVRIITDIPQFVGMDTKVYGPFKSGDICFLPTKEAELLKIKKMAEEIK